MAFTWTRPPDRRDDGAAFDPASVSPAQAAAAAVSPMAVEALGQQRTRAGALLVDLYGYLDTHAQGHPGLAAVLPAMRSAVAEYRAGTSADPLSGPRTVYAAIQAVRRADPALPDP